MAVDETSQTLVVTWLGGVFGAACLETCHVACAEWMYHK